MLSISRPAVARFRRSVAVVSVAVSLLAACSGGHKPATPAPTPSSTRGVGAARVTHLLRIGASRVVRVGSLGSVDRPTRRAVLASAQRYVDRAVLAPLETGNVARGYAALFAPGVRAAAIGPDAGALTDRVIGVTTTLNEESTPVTLSALLDKSGALLYLATRFNVKVDATRPGGEIVINRSVELTYERVGTSWLVAAYRVKVTRRAPARAIHRTTAAVASSAGDVS